MKKNQWRLLLAIMFNFYLLNAFGQLIPTGVPPHLSARWSEFTAAEKAEILSSTFLTATNPSSGGTVEGTSSYAAAGQPCTNADFENGTLSGWVRTTGFNPGCCPTSGGSQTIVSGTATDPCGGFPVVAPGGSFSVLLGDNSTGAHADRLEQTFLVSTSNSSFTYKYAVVLEDPNHAAGDQPFFEIEMRDASGVLIPCTYYKVTSGQGIPGFKTSSTCGFNTIYKPWTTVLVDLNSYIGQNVTIRFTVNDCSLGGHYGYAYVDGACGSLSLNQQKTICNTETVCAPEGFATYLWNGPGVVNQPGRCISINNAGTYTIKTTQVTGCPGPTITYVITQAGGPELIHNGNFQAGPLPQWRGQINFATGWFASSGGPDLFDAKFTNCLPSPIPSGIPPCNLPVANINCIGIPCNHFGYQQHHINPNGTDGRYAGLYHAIAGTDMNFSFVTGPPYPYVRGDVRLNMIVEGMEQKLVSPLVPNRQYCMEFYGSLAENAEVENILADKEAYFVVKMSTQAEYGAGIVNDLLPYNPAPGDIIYQGKVTDKVNWEKIAFKFIPAKPYTHVIIERYYPENLIMRLSSFDVSDPTQLDKLNIQSYMFIDDVSLRLCCNGGTGNTPLRADAGEDYTICTTSSPVMLGGAPTGMGGVAPYSYLWSNGSTMANPTVSVTTTTTFRVTVTDAVGNVDMDEVTVFVGGSTYSFVPNGGYESGALPLAPGQIESSTGWFKATGDPDLFDENYFCGSAADPTCVSIPQNYEGVESHRTPSGKRYAGVWAFNGFGVATAIDGRLPGDQGGVPPIREVHDVTRQRALLYLEFVEGMDQTFTFALDPTKTYELSYHLSFAEGRIDNTVDQLPASTQTTVNRLIDRVDPLAQNKEVLQSPYGAVVVKMSDMPIVRRLDYQPVDLPIMFYDTVGSKNGWTYKSHLFTPGTAYKYIVIESQSVGSRRVELSQNPSTTVTPNVNTAIFSTYSMDQGYVYIDDVRLIEVCDPNNARRGRPSDHSGNIIQPVQPATSPLGIVNVYPNPSKGSFTVSYNLDADAGQTPVTISVYNAIGQLVKNTVINSAMQGVNHEDINLGQNGSVAEGLYIVKIVCGDKSTTQRINVIR